MTMKHSTPFVLALVFLGILAMPIMETGCAAQQTASELISVVGNAVASILTLEGNTADAQKLKTDSATAAQQVANWQNGSPAQEATEALNLLEDDLNLIPAVDKYAPLVDIAIAAVDTLLAQLSGSAASAGMSFLGESLSSSATNPAHRHPAVKAPKNAKQFKKAWNSLLKTHPEWKLAPLK